MRLVIAILFGALVMPTPADAQNRNRDDGIYAQTMRKIEESRAARTHRKVVRDERRREREAVRVYRMEISR